MCHGVLGTGRLFASCLGLSALCTANGSATLLLLKANLSREQVGTATLSLMRTELASGSHENGLTDTISLMGKE